MQADNGPPSSDAAARFDAYVTERGGELWRSAWLLTGDVHHAEDLVQAALLRTYGRFAAFDSERHFEAYVRTTLFRTFVSWRRRRHWRSEMPSALEPDTVADVGDDPPMQASDLRRALFSLPRSQRAVLVLRYFEDMTVIEVGELLQMPTSTVKSHARRGLVALRRSPHLLEQDMHS
ncbi:RNA polymerase sigma-E factor [Tessaracoccus sp. O5.2]|uniref:SigE family RNA polymerase sigma factor n=1 Tax=Tessaracoccus TaxID=72763 RepID=UPI00099DB675|nr:MULTISPECIES: SigE family RNA polymerase sigma factor [Tessaracoccus]AQX14951.1 hypothetical protein BKM78_02665 [Tessaracoccus sp. T2.5-30]VEP39117.1 RNA polymerase sigma-E factor [Tessaracoccus lapidicaptus]